MTDEAVLTSRFGTLQVPGGRIIEFPDGLLGFPEHTRYAVLEPAKAALFWWLQSCDEPTLAFVVTDPSIFVADYSVPLSPERFKSLGLSRLEDAQVFVIVNKTADGLTGNLQGPLVVNTVNCRAVQLILSDPRWTTRHALASVAGGGEGA